MPAKRKPRDVPVVKAGTGQHISIYYARKDDCELVLNHPTATASPNKPPSLDCMAAVVGTGQKDKPKVDERI